MVFPDGEEGSGSETGFQPHGRKPVMTPEDLSPPDRWSRQLLRFGTLATIRMEVVSSSNCSHGRI